MALSKNAKYQLEIEKELIRHKCIIFLLNITKNFYLKIFGFIMIIILDLLLLAIIAINIEYIFHEIIIKGKYIISLIEFSFWSLFVLFAEILYQFWIYLLAFLFFYLIYTLNLSSYESLIKARNNAKEVLGAYFNQGFLRHLNGGNIFFGDKKALKVNSKDIFIQWTKEHDKPFKDMLENSLKKVFLFNAYEKICKSFILPLSFYKKVPGKKEKYTEKYTPAVEKNKLEDLITQAIEDNLGVGYTRTSQAISANSLELKREAQKDIWDL